jgi:hypothetical protein
MTREQFQCLNCGGKYFDLCLDGQIYFHVCSPLPPDENGISLPRPNARNETNCNRSPDLIPAITSEGLGVNCLTNQNLLEPAWITHLKNRAQKEEQE